MPKTPIRHGGSAPSALHLSGPLALMLSAPVGGTAALGAILAFQGPWWLALLGYPLGGAATILAVAFGSPACIRQPSGIERLPRLSPSSDEQIGEFAWVIARARARRPHVAQGHHDKDLGDATMAVNAALRPWFEDPDGEVDRVLAGIDGPAVGISAPEVTRLRAIEDAARLTLSVAEAAGNRMGDVTVPREAWNELRATLGLPPRRHA